MDETCKQEMLTRQQQQQLQVATLATTYSTRTPSIASTFTIRTLSISLFYTFFASDDIKDEIIGSNDADNPLKLLSSVAVSVQDQEQNYRPKRNLDEDSRKIDNSST
ncbi:hypothetical protein Glove_60g59 [Diversispora epigaea]|uniref:Uncharacterized protein n=1 Tax=Diversispora epigaea TaxID=1348612 RepID=A0A397JMU8_9GLOM|nr:hypothetical protein Glove_60g59 [Diversispora epigaea]